MTPEQLENRGLRGMFLGLAVGVVALVLGWRCGGAVFVAFLAGRAFGMARMSLSFASVYRNLIAAQVTIRRLRDGRTGQKLGDVEAAVAAGLDSYQHRAQRRTCTSR